MLCGHINVEIISSHKVRLVSLLQDFSESLTYDVWAKSPGVTLCLIPPVCLVVEILFSLSNYRTRLHEIHPRKWGSSWNFRLHSKLLCIQGDFVSPTWAFWSFHLVRPRRAPHENEFGEQGGRRRIINYVHLPPSNMKQGVLTFGQIVGLQRNVVISSLLLHVVSIYGT